MALMMTWIYGRKKKKLMTASEDSALEPLIMFLLLYATFEQKYHCLAQPLL